MQKSICIPIFLIYIIFQILQYLFFDSRNIGTADIKPLGNFSLSERFCIIQAVAKNNNFLFSLVRHIPDKFGHFAYSAFFLQLLDYIRIVAD